MVVLLSGFYNFRRGGICRYGSGFNKCGRGLISWELTKNEPNLKGRPLQHACLVYKKFVNLAVLLLTCGVVNLAVLLLICGVSF